MRLFPAAKFCRCLKYLLAAHLLNPPQRQRVKVFPMTSNNRYPYQFRRWLWYPHAILRRHAGNLVPQRRLKRQRYAVIRQLADYTFTGEICVGRGL